MKESTKREIRGLVILFVVITVALIALVAAATATAGH